MFLRCEFVMERVMGRGGGVGGGGVGFKFEVF